MKFIAVLTLLVLLTAVGCGGAAETDSGQGDGATTTPATSPAAAGGEDDLTRRWGPAEQPDPDAQPLEFLYWRVDGMFDRTDLDSDGRLTVDEFRGETYNFQRLDANSDGFVTKKEIIDDTIPSMREEGKIP